jgi:hypothetical protein
MRLCPVFRIIPFNDSSEMVIASNECLQDDKMMRLIILRASFINKTIA